MQSGYFSGTAPLNSSRATVTSFNASGVSTLAGAVTVNTVVAGSTAATIGSTSVEFKELYVSSLFIGGQAAQIQSVYARVSGSTVNVPAASSASVAWPTNDFLSNSSIHSTSANPEQFIPQSTGVYALHATLTFSTMTGTASSRHLAAEILDSSGGQHGWTLMPVPEAGGGSAFGGGPSVRVNAMKRFDDLSATPYFRISVKAGSASTTSLNGTLSYADFFRI